MKALRILSILAVCASPVLAGTFTVTNTNDSGAGSLRQAIADANDGDTIDASGVSGTILLTSDELQVTHNVTINGPGPANLAVDGNATFRVFDNFASNVTISGLTITNGLGNAAPAGGGGGILNQGGLTLGNCTVSNNVAGLGCCYDGGGILNGSGATLTVTDSTISGNSASYDGGGIENAGTLTVSASITSSNSAGRDGGGIDDNGYGPSMTISDSAISGNSASGSGGGICACGYGAPTTMVTNSTISDNSANDGGGIENLVHLNNSDLTVLNSTISGNSVTGSAQGGGGISNVTGTATVTNSTISGNSVPQGFGGGISNYTGSLAINESTFDGNSASPGSGGTIYNNAGGTIQMMNTVLNAGATETIFNGATFISVGYNLASDDGAAALTGPGDQINTDPILGPLQDNDGPTFTHALLRGSPAIDAGDPNFTPPPDDDQRGAGFPRVGSGRIDIGAFEVHVPVELGNISTRLNVGTGDNVLIGGFILTGTEPNTVVIRALGPSLEAEGVTGALQNPTLELHHPDNTGKDVILASNDDWNDQDTISKEIILSSDLAPTDAREAALAITLGSGAYTAIVRGVDNTTGVSLVEVYDLDTTNSSMLANISTRGFVQTGDNVMIGGVIILGDAAANVIVRGIGPSLPLAGALQDPTLELHDAQGAMIASNDNWRSDQEAEIIASMLPPTNDAEAAIITTLNPGPYTAIVRGANATTGIALVEAYQLGQ